MSLIDRAPDQQIPPRPNGRRAYVTMPRREELGSGLTGVGLPVEGPVVAMIRDEARADLAAAHGYLTSRDLTPDGRAWWAGRAHALDEIIRKLA